MPGTLLRIVLYVLLLWVFSFAIIEIRPGDPALAIAGKRAKAAEIERIRAEYGFDRGFFERLAHSVARYTEGDFGRTLDGRPVASLIATAIPKTVELALFAAVFALGLTLGAALAGISFPRLGTFFDQGTLFVLATPIFVVGLLLLYIFYFYLEAFPPGGYGPFVFLVLPGVTLGLKSFGRLYFFFRDTLNEELIAPWFKAFRARGLGVGQLVMPLLFAKLFAALAGILLIELAGLFAGAIVVEQVFFFPGLGALIFEALTNDDRILLQALLFVGGTFFVVFLQTGKYLQTKVLTAS